MEAHRDHVRDQARDHETKPDFGLLGLGRVAVDLLQAVADGREESFALAHELVAAVLDVPVVRRARELEELLKTRSPFALVRAVELAEALGMGERPVAQGARGGRRGAT
jgi:hypothetical protein